MTRSSRKCRPADAVGSGRSRSAGLRRGGSLLRAAEHGLAAARALTLALLLCALGLAVPVSGASLGGQLCCAEASAEKPPLQEPSGGATEVEASSLPASRRTAVRSLPGPVSTLLAAMTDRVRASAGARPVRPVRQSTARAPLRC